VDDFRFKHRMPTRAAAVREFLRLGLTVEPTDGDGPMAMVRSRATTEFSAVARTAIARVRALDLQRTDHCPARFLDTAKPDRSALRRLFRSAVPIVCSISATLAAIQIDLHRISELPAFPFLRRSRRIRALIRFRESFGNRSASSHAA
jgi:hypothetical protein